MNKENKERIHNFVLDNYEYVQSRLPRDGIHKRNAYAHFYWCLKEVWKVKCVDEIPDKDFNKVMDVLQIIVDNAEREDVESLFPKIVVNTLDYLFK